MQSSNRTFQWRHHRKYYSATNTHKNKRLETRAKYRKRCKEKYQKNLFRLSFQPDLANCGRLTTIYSTHWRQRFSTTWNVFFWSTGRAMHLGWTWAFKCVINRTGTHMLAIYNIEHLSTRRIAEMRHISRKCVWRITKGTCPLNVGFCKLGSAKLHCFETALQSSLRPHPQERR